MSIKFLVTSFVVLVWLFLISQVFWPMLRGTKLFPVLSYRRRKALKRIQAAKELEEQLQLEEKANQLERKVGKDVQ